MRRCLILLLAAASAYAVSFVLQESVLGGDGYWNARSSLRLTGRTLCGPVKLEAAWELTASAGDPPLTEVARTPFRLTDMDPMLMPGEIDPDTRLTLLHDLDRLYAQGNLGRLRITAGRQAVYWGVSKTVSPTDLIAPFAYGTVDDRFRTGVDALRLTYAAGPLSEAEAGALFSGNADTVSLWSRGRFYLARTDVTCVLARFRGTTMAGGSLSRALGGSAVWAESAVLRREDADTWWSLSTGIERSFLEGLIYGFAEYHHNSRGTDETRETGITSLQGSDYAASGLTLRVTPLLTVTAGALVNAGDGSARLDASSEYSVSANGALEAGMTMGTGHPREEFQGPGLSAYGFYSLYF